MTRILIACTCLACIALTPIPSFAAEAGLGCDGEWADDPLCRERKEALDALAEVEYLLSALEAVSEPPWNPFDYVEANKVLEEGKTFYQDEYFGDAAQRFKVAIDALALIKDSFEALVDDTLSEGRDMLRREEYQSAAQRFRDVLVWLPGSDEAQEGITISEAGIKAEQALDQTFALIENDQLDQAEALLKSVPGGFFPSRVGQARAQIREKIQRDIEGNHLSEGYRNIDAGRYRQAVASFQAALKVSPNSREARDGLAEASRLLMDVELTRLRAQHAEQLEQEQWQQARDTLNEIAAIDPDGASSEQELARLEQLIRTEQRLDTALATMGKPLSKVLRDDFRALIAEVDDPARYGQRIHGKKLQLETEFTAWTTPVPLTIRSDNRTDVQIRPGRRIGQLRQEELMVLPGKYVLIGRRKGFREKRTTIELAPGSGGSEVEVICNERF